MPRGKVKKEKLSHTYERQSAAEQAMRERIKLAAIAYLKEAGRGAACSEIAKAIGHSPSIVGRIVEEARMTFTTDRISSNGANRGNVMVWLHRQLMVAS